VTSSNSLNGDLTVLHAARIKGVISPDGEDAMAPEDTITGLVDAGLLKIGGRGVALTSAGLKRHAELLTVFRQETDVATVAATYERFLALNAPVKASCARWQQSDRDAESLFQVADELGGFLERLRPALVRASEAAPWFEQYGVRLTNAWQRASNGDERFVTDPHFDSFHTIWFECHEDYLVTLGRSREEEERQ
jgi:hypothetical protein